MKRLHSSMTMYQMKEYEYYGLGLDGEHIQRASVMTLFPAMT